MNLGAFFHSTRFRVLLCVLALLTGVLIYSARQGAHTDALTRTFQFLTAPARELSASVSGSVNEKLDTYFKSKAYRDENARLREQIAKLNEQLVGYEEAERELAALRDQLKIKEKNNGFVLSEPCRVLMPVTNDPTGSFLIDMGEEDGLTLNAPVICSQGLVGVITALSPRSATVTTLLSPEMSIGALVLEAGETGIAEGTYSLAAKGQCKLIYLEKSTKVKEGNLVLTAGTTGLFPYGLAVGNVIETGLEDTGLTSYAILAPAVDYEALESVSVLLDFSGKGVSVHED